MTGGDDELDNLFRDHFAGELTPMRGQAGRAFAREVLSPMRRHLARDQWRYRLRTASQATFTLAACTALGFYVPQWLTGSPAGPSGDPTSSVLNTPTFVNYESLAVPGQNEATPSTWPTRQAN